MKNKKTIIIFFDIGGVLLSDGWGSQSRQNAASIFGYDYEENEALHDYVSGIFETGKISINEYLDRTVFHKKRSFLIKNFKEFMFQQSEELPQMLQWLKHWKKESEFSIIALNNESKEINDYRIEKFGLHDCFDAFISSCIVGLRKPDPDIFRLALRLAHSPPENCLFFDDRLFHVQSARLLGFHAHQHKSFKNTKTILENL